MPAEIGIALVATGVGLGLRHGIDWDHIAAISDVTGTQKSRPRAFVMGSLYALGHAAVVVALGVLAIVLGAQLPDWVDGYMETLVGLTLIGLAIWIFWSLWRTRGGLVLKSRWMLVFDGARALWRKALGKPPLERRRGGSYGPATSTGIGMIHGIGAETGSQALILAGAAGATSELAGTFLLAAFAVGLVLSNTLITIASIVGFVGMRARKWTQISLGMSIGLFSLVIGTLFLLQKGGVLPGIFA
ncbi:MAG: hypothetical protein IH961_02215 [Chloroflexi bacterium]|nr:hypothetical protein [Chloroflexota bacterium]